MFKVVCINNRPLPNRSHNWATERLIEGNTYTVIKVITDCDPGLPPAYKLGEIEKGAYCSSRFIPLSDIDEATFERDYNKEPEWIEAFNKLTIKPTT